MNPDVVSNLHCVSCGYDLRDQPVAGKCPECGTAISISRSATGFDFPAGFQPAWIRAAAGCLIGAFLLEASGWILWKLSFLYTLQLTSWSRQLAYELAQYGLCASDALIAVAILLVVLAYPRSRRRWLDWIPPLIAFPAAADELFSVIRASAFFPLLRGIGGTMADALSQQNSLLILVAMVPPLFWIRRGVPAHRHRRLRFGMSLAVGATILLALRELFGWLSFVGWTYNFFLIPRPLTMMFTDEALRSYVSVPCRIVIILSLVALTRKMRRMPTSPTFRN